jgi:hypothetical protein
MDPPSLERRIYQVYSVDKFPVRSPNLVNYSPRSSFVYKYISCPIYSLHQEEGILVSRGFSTLETPENPCKPCKLGISNITFQIRSFCQFPGFRNLGNLETTEYLQCNNHPHKPSKISRYIRFQISGVSGVSISISIGQFQEFCPT